MAKKKQTSGWGWGVLAFFFPFVGFILWLAWKDSNPEHSRSAGIGMLVAILLAIGMALLAIAAYALGWAELIQGGISLIACIIAIIP